MTKNKNLKMSEVKKSMEPKSFNIPMLILGMFVIGAVFGGGMFFLLGNPQTIECQDFNLSEADFNKLVNLEYSGGFCERIGLISSVKVEDFEGTPYGIPICVQGEQ